MLGKLHIEKSWLILEDQSEPTLPCRRGLLNLPASSEKGARSLIERRFTTRLWRLEKYLNWL